MCILELPTFWYFGPVKHLDPCGAGHAPGALAKGDCGLKPVS